MKAAYFQRLCNEDEPLTTLVLHGYQWYVTESRSTTYLGHISPCSRVLLQKLLVTHLVKKFLKFLTFLWNPKFITVIRTARHWALSWTWACFVRFMETNNLAVFGKTEQLVSLFSSVTLWGKHCNFITNHLWLLRLESSSTSIWQVPAIPVLTFRYYICLMQ
jgi:hypothetical protein